MKKLIAYPVLMIASVLFLTLSCKKEFTLQADQNVPPPVIVKKEIRVSDIYQLYNAVNNPENGGCRIVLDPGTYALSSSYPNSGRLELQTDMDMRGKQGYPEQVIIDQTALPTTSFNLTGGGRTGGIRMGKGFNSLEWLTVKGNVNALSAIDTDLPSAATRVRIAHIIVSGSQIGIDVRNRLAEHAGRKIDADIESNEALGNNAGFGTGIAIQNANGANGAVIRANLIKNYIHGNRVGFRTFTNAAGSTVNNCKIIINSTDDKIEGNGLGMYIGGGLSQVATGFANDNELYMKVWGSSISNNNPVPMPPEIMPIEAGIPSGGIYAVGGISTVGDDKVSNNKLTVDFWGTDISNNHGNDINVFGAWCRPPAVFPGIKNVTELNLYGISNLAVIEATHCVPYEPAGTNVVNVYHY